MGGPQDIAYKNPMDDYTRVNHVRSSCQSRKSAMAGTYRQPHGGRVSLGFASPGLNWQLKNDAHAGQQFLDQNSDLRQDPNWKIEIRISMTTRQKELRHTDFAPMSAREARLLPWPSREHSAAAHQHFAG